MRVAQTIRRLIWRCSWLVACAACESKKARPDLHKPALRAERPLSAASVATSRAAFVASTLAQTLRSVHEQKLEITPSSDPALRLAFGPGRLLQASINRVVLRDTKTGKPVVETELEGVRAVAQGVDGALFALGASGGVRFAARTTAVTRFAHVAFFPGSGLFPDLENPDFFYVYARGQPELYRYAFAADRGAFLPIDGQFPMPGCGGIIGLMHDGAFVCRTALGILRRVPRARQLELKLPAGAPEPFGLLSANRLDELFSVSPRGDVVRLRLVSGLPELGRFRLPAAPYAAASNSDSLAFVLVSAPELGAPRHWSLLVTDYGGALRFQTELSSTLAPEGDNWLEAVTEAKRLAISGFEPLVAVGGAHELRAWNYLERREQFAR